MGALSHVIWIIQDGLNSCKEWLKLFKVECSDETAILFVGNKCDLEQKIRPESLTQLAREENSPYFFTSAKTGENVSESFNE